MLDFLSPKVPIEHSLFRLPRFSALMGGFWPQQQGRSWLTVARFWLNAFAVAFGAIGENLYGVMYVNDLVSALEAFCPGVTKAISLLKMLLFFGYSRDWMNIVQRMRAMVFSACVGSDEKRCIMQDLSSLSSRFSFVLLMAGSATNMFFNLRPFMMNAWRMWQDQEVQNELPFNVVIPEVFSNYPWYPLTYCMLTLSGAMTVFTFSAVDGFFVCACFYVSGLFGMLQYDIRHAFDTLETQEHATAAQNAQIRLKLADIVVRHNSIIDLCSDFTAQFTPIILMHFLSAAFVLCSSLLDLMLNSASIGFLIYICYSIAALTQLFLYCIGGNYVSESSLTVADTLYDIEWYKCDTRTRKMILMMMRRAQKAKTIAVPFFTPSLSAFSSIISTTGSYVTMLKTFL